MNLHKHAFSRRQLAKGAAVAALTAIAQPPSASTSVSASTLDESGLTSVQMQEVEARFKETLRCYGDRLSEDQRNRIRRVLVDNQRMLTAIRDFPLDNGDTPATTLKLRIENPSSTEHK